MSDEQRPKRRVRDSSYFELLARGDTYGLLLAIILVDYVVMALATRSLWERALVTVMLGGSLLLALHTSHVRARGFRIGAIFVALAIAANTFQAIIGREGNDGSTYVIFVLVLVAPVVILNRILRHRVVTLETILGAVCVYVLFAIAFAGIYAAVNDAETTGFFAQNIVPTNVDFLYFSFVTITTVGYGDLTAGTSLGRVLVTFEALLGQIFLVTLVARLVSLYGNARRAEPDGPASAGSGAE